MKTTIEQLEQVIEGIELALSASECREEKEMIQRAKDEAMRTLTTLRYINQ